MSLVNAEFRFDRRPRIARKEGVRAFDVRVADDWSEVELLWNAGGRGAAATPFQNAAWLESLYRAHLQDHRVAPLIVTVTDAVTGEWALQLPLVYRVGADGVRSIEFADLGHTDYNAPVLGPAAPRTRTDAKALWDAIRAALPDADLVHFIKMPEAVAGRVNPLTLLPGTRTSALNGNLITMDEDYDAWRYTLERTVRKELERSWRVFTRNPDAAFRIITEPAEALAVLAATEEQQGERMRERGVEYRMDDPPTVAFYRSLVEHGVRSGYVLLTALTCGSDIVATLLGIQDGDTYIAVRISNQSGAWSNCSPGRLVLERTMAYLHGQGVRKVDFSVGNYAYKRRFNPVRTRLMDVSMPLSLKGRMKHLRFVIAEKIRRYPDLDRRVRRALGLKITREEG